MRKQEGKLKSVSQLNVRDQRAIRKRNRIAQNRFRLKNKTNNEELCIANEVQVVNDVNENITSKKVTSKQAIAREKRSTNNKKLCYRNNVTLYRHNIQLKTNVKRSQKRLQRLEIKNKKKNDANSPISIVDNFLNSNKIVVPAEVRKKLYFSEVIKSQIKTSYKESIDSKYKKILKTTLSGQIVKKYRFLHTVKKWIPVPFYKKKITNKIKETGI